MWACIIMVTFETKVWENDWKIVMGTGRLKSMIGRHNYPFVQKNLIINNVSNRKQVEAQARILIAAGVLTDYYVADDYAAAALDKFGLTRPALGIGYYYSIAELVGIYLCQSKYLLHYSSDSILAKGADWLTPAINIMDHDAQVKVANACWNNNYAAAKNEAVKENKDCFWSHGLSDQCYLVRAADFKAKIYNESNTLSDRYPKYGGELFEKRVDSWLRNNHYWRVTSRHNHYWHHNFPKSGWRKLLRQKIFYNY